MKMSIQASLLQKLCYEHPDSYVKCDNDYIPVRSELFDFAHTRAALSKVFTIEQYKGLPVIAVLEAKHKDIFHLFYKFRLTDMWELPITVELFLFLSYFIGDLDEMTQILHWGNPQYRFHNPVVNWVDQPTKLWLDLFTHGISPLFLLLADREYICRKLILKRLKEKDAEEYSFNSERQHIFKFLADPNDLIAYAKFYHITLGQITNYNPTYSYYNITMIGDSTYFIYPTNPKTPQNMGKDTKVCEDVKMLSGDPDLKIYMSVKPDRYYCIYSNCCAFKTYHAHGN